MKRIIYGLLACLVLTSGGRAEEGKAGPEVTASLKVWVNEWNHYDPGAGRKTANHIMVLAGPAAEVECTNRVVLEGSYVTSLSAYTFTEAGVSTKFDRRDIELGIGKWLNHYAAFFVGYRNSAFTEKETGNKEFSYGLYYSVRGELPLRGRSALYGNLTYLSARFKAEGEAREEAPGWITDIGGRSYLTEHLAVKVGYTWETAKGDASGVKDTFRGTTFELAYAF